MKKPAKIMTIRREDQRRVFASPKRMEIIGLFIERKPLSVADIAERMGRPASAIHYHVRVMEKAGILRRAGERRDGRRPEALYVPVAEMFQMEQKQDDEAASKDVLKTMSVAFRMALSDMKAALTNPKVKTGGPHRNTFGARVHCRLSKKDLAELNRHLMAIQKLAFRVQKNHKPSKNDSFVSLTVALMPLRSREVQP